MIGYTPRKLMELEFETRHRGDLQQAQTDPRQLAQGTI